MISSYICIPDGKQYVANELKHALQEASRISVNKSKTVVINFPDRTIPLTEAVELSGDIVIKGRSKTLLRISDSGLLILHGSLSIETLEVEKIEKLNLPAFIVSGSFTMRDVTFIDSTVLTLNKASVDFKKCVFRQQQPENGKIRNFALTFHGVGSHKVSECVINKFSGGIRCQSFTKEQVLAEITRCRFHSSLFGVYLSNAKCTLEACNFLMESKDAVVILGNDTKCDVKECANANISNDKELADKVKAFGGPEGVYVLAKRAFELYKEGSPSSKTNCYELLTFIMTWLEEAPYVKDSLNLVKFADSLEMSLFFSLVKSNQGKSLLAIKDAVDTWGTYSMNPMDFEGGLIIANKSALNHDMEDEELFMVMEALEGYRKTSLMIIDQQQQKEYLVQLAALDPLRFWYVVSTEIPIDGAHKHMRYDVFFEIAAMSQRETDPVKKARLAWVFQWGCHAMGHYFREETVPVELVHRIAWTDTLLDLEDEATLLQWYNIVEFPALPIDAGVRFEANFRQQHLKKSNKQEYQGMISRLIQEADHRSGMEEAVRNFSGLGPLPGYVRRMTENAFDFIDVLKALRAGYDVAQMDREKKRRFCLAVLDNFHLRTSPKSNMNTAEPAGKLEYNTCPICFRQKLYPWSSMHLNSSSPKHTFCLDCLKDSMSTGDRGLWGVCPGNQKDEDKVSLASRQEMELCGMDTDKIYNIIDVRVDQSFSRIDGWVRCPLCSLGGTQKNDLSYYVCHLCGCTIHKTGTDHALTVKLNLLKGLDSNKVRRGEGVFRECYHCSAVYEKGNACSTITCGKCKKEFNMSWGSKNINHNYDDNGVGIQRYIPKTAGVLWSLEVFKKADGSPLELGQELSEAEAAHVVKLAKEVLEKLENS